jgi:pyridoxal phosphate enzyme (YggS family)
VAPPRWHFIGRLQRNKARHVAARFDLVETLDREALGDELDRRAAAAGRRLDVLLQVDVVGEPQKGGAKPEDLPALLERSRSWGALRVVGLMAIPLETQHPEHSRPAFARLRALRDALRDAPGAGSLRALSMGMSADFEVAIEEGATIVRVGTALFGARQDAQEGDA